MTENHKLKHSGFAFLIPLIILGMIILIIFIGGACVGFVGNRQGTNHTGDMITEDAGSVTEDEKEELGPIPPSCGGVIEKAQAYLNRSPRIYYSQRQPHCGSFAAYGPENIGWIDCSGYASRAFRDAGLNTSCFTSMSVRSNSQFVKITGSVSQARKIAAPGDLMVIEGHVVIFGGWQGSKTIIYESTPRPDPGGPVRRIYNDWFTKYDDRFVGVYRPKKCNTTSQSPINSILKYAANENTNLSL